MATINPNPHRSRYASIIAVWLVGLLSMAALSTALESLPLMSLLLPWSVFAALLIAALVWRGGWSRAANVGQTAGVTPTPVTDSERLDEELDQSFPASDPPAFTSGIARVQSAQ